MDELMNNADDNDKDDGIALCWLLVAVSFQ